LSSSETKQIIEGIEDPTLRGLNFRCEPTGCNGNWSIEVHTKNPEWIEEIIGIIEANLFFALREKGL
jgi:hypothetical protein